MDPGLKIYGSRTPDILTPFNLKPVQNRMRATFNWSRPATYLVMGNRGTGKSSLIEVLAERHNKIIDLYGSKDNENLCWCRKSSPIDDILLIHGENTHVDAPFDTKSTDKLTLKDIESYEATVTCNAFFSSDKVKFSSLEHVTNCLEQRTEWKESDLMFMAFRETMDLVYSKMSQGQGEKDAKSNLLYFMRQLRHFGVSVGADMLRWTGIDKEMRDLSEYIIFKKLGWKGLPGDISFVFSYVEPVTFRYLNFDQCVVLQENGNIALGKYGLPKYHKEEGVDLLKEIGITVEHDQELEESTQQKVGDKEHADILRLYNEEESMMVVAKKLQRSSATISFHVSYHNEQIEETGVCPRCKRANSDLSETQIHTIDKPPISV